MADYATLKAAIQAVIYENGNQEITGAVMQSTLLAMVSALGANYQYAGIATPATNPGTPDQNVFYLASTAGTYVNFGNIVLAENEVAILKYNGNWTKEASGFASAEKVNQLDQKVDDLDTIVNGGAQTITVDGATIGTLEKGAIKGNGDLYSNNNYRRRFIINDGYIRAVGHGSSYANYSILAFYNSTTPSANSLISSIVTPTSYVDVPFDTQIPEGTQLIAVTYNAVEQTCTPAEITLYKEVAVNGLSQLGREVDGINTSYNNAILLMGEYVDGTDGTAKENSYRSRTNYIEITPGAKVVFTCYGSASPAGQGYALYNASKQFISGGVISDAEVHTITIPEIPSGAKYIRISYVGSSNANFASFSLVETSPGMVEELAQIKEDIATLEDTIDQTIDTVDAMVEYEPPQKKYESDFQTVGLYKTSAAEVDSTYANYRALPLIPVVEGQTIVYHDWQKGVSGTISEVAAIFLYDNDGLPYNGTDARKNYKALTTKDYENGNYTFVIPSNCSQIGLSFNFGGNYPVGADAYIKVGDEKYEFTDLAKTMINAVVEEGNEVGGDSAKYFLKGNSNIVYDAAKKLGIIAAGQSNIDGRNSYSDLPAGFVNPNSKVHFKNTENGAFAPFEVTDGGQGNDWSFDAIVYNLLTDSLHGNLSDIYVMKKSMGGTSIDPLGATDYHWTADYEFLESESASLLRSWEDIIRAGVASNGSSFDIKAVLWHQGEGDSQTEAVASRYYDNLKNMLAYIRGVVGNPRLYVFCGNMSLNATNLGYKQIINAAYTKLASEDPYLKVVDMSNAQLEDGYHFNYQWSIYFGQKVYDLMIDAGIISGTKINPSEPS